MSNQEHKNLTQAGQSELTDGLCPQTETEQLRATLRRAREAMVLLAALAGSEYNKGVPWAEIAEEARSLGA